jgi:hypothetical protein
MTDIEKSVFDHIVRHTGMKGWSLYKKSVNDFLKGNLNKPQLDALLSDLFDFERGEHIIHNRYIHEILTNLDNIEGGNAIKVRKKEKLSFSCDYRHVKELSTDTTCDDLMTALLLDWQGEAGDKTSNTILSQVASKAARVLLS